MCWDKNEIEAPFTREEIESALSGMKEGTAPGASGVTTTMWKRMGEFGIQALTKEINDIWVNGKKVPTQWKQLRMRLLHKGGEIEDIGNYRPIALAEVAGKVMSNTILNRIEKDFEQKGAYAAAQAGWRRGRGTAFHLIPVTELLRRDKIRGNKLSWMFVDLVKAFDNVSMEAVEELLIQHGMSEKNAKTIIDLQNNTKVRILTDEGTTDEFTAKRGTKQGDPLSPLIFAMVINPLLKHWERKRNGTKLLGGKHVVFAYADDMLIVTEDSSEIIACLRDLKQYDEWMGLQVSPKKSLIWSNEMEMEFIEGIKVSKDPKESYKYLGVWLNRDLDWRKQMEEKNMKIEKTASWAKSKQISWIQKAYVLNAIVQAIMAYTAMAFVPPRKWLENVESKVLKSALTGITNRVKAEKEAIYRDRNNGGLGLIKTEEWVRSAAISAVIRYLNRMRIENKAICREILSGPQMTKYQMQRAENRTITSVEVFNNAQYWGLHGIDRTEH